MKGIIGRKVGMMQLFDETGKAIPVTVISAGPCKVTEIRTQEKDGYTAVQMGFGEVKENKVKKPVAGFYKKINVSPMRVLREFRANDTKGFEIGQEIKASIFEAGQYVDVVGTSIGKGFAGGIKRHHFNGGPKTHGSMSHRKPCSGGATDAARTIKGTRKPGHMGNERVTAQGLKVVRVDGEKNLIIVKGAVPGAKKGLLMIKESVINKK
ncbi:50S ribosomal protein L3 [bacterium]|nr:50S ribosomal protein L3 [bacterium]